MCDVVTVKNTDLQMRFLPLEEKNRFLKVRNERKKMYERMRDNPIKLIKNHKVKEKPVVNVIQIAEQKELHNLHH